MTEASPDLSAAAVAIDLARGVVTAATARLAEVGLDAVFLQTRVLAELVPRLRPLAQVTTELVVQKAGRPRSKRQPVTATLAWPGAIG